MTLVALSAAYGAGGSRVGPRLAQRLDVPFLDRAIPLAVAERLQVPVDDALAQDEAASVGLLDRLLESFALGDAGMAAPLPGEFAISQDFRHACEQVIAEQARSGAGVILGRGAAVVLRDDPRVLRARLTGPTKDRVRQAVSLAGIDEERAQAARRRIDAAHAAYLRQHYGAEIDDPSLYHLVLDSTAIPLETCVEVLALAASALHSGRVVASGHG